MQTLLDIAAALLPLFYLLLAVGYGVLFVSPDSAIQRWIKPFLRLTLGLHLGFLILLSVRWQQFPAATVSQVFSGIAFAVAAVYLFVEWHGRVASTGFWILSGAFLFELLSSLLRTDNPPDRAILHSPHFAAHAALGLIGYAAFVVAAVYGFLFLRLYRELKRKGFSTFFGKLPPLEVLEKMMSGALAVGFAALTGAVISGAIWAENIAVGGWQRDPKILYTVATWLFYGLALVLRRLRPWHGRHTAVASLAGLVAILFSAVAVNVFFTDLHGFL